MDMIMPVDQMNSVFLAGNQIVTSAFNYTDLCKTRILAKYPTKEVTIQAFDVFLHWLDSEYDSNVFYFPVYNEDTKSIIPVA